MLRSRSPVEVACIALAACALCLLGVALAGGTSTTLRPHLGGAVAEHRMAPLRQPARNAPRGHAVPERAATLHRPPPVAAARPARRVRTMEVAMAVPVGSPRGAAVTPTSPGGHGPHRGPSPTAAETPASPAEPTSPTPKPQPPSPPTGGPTSALYWGASIGSHLTGEQAPWDMDAVTKFEQIAGKEVSLVNFFGPFANCSTSPCSFYKLPTGPMENIRAYGAIPVYSWSSQSIPSQRSEPDFQLSDTIAGTYDSYIRKFAEDAKKWGHPFFLRFNWEMNGTWFPWSEGVNGNQPGEFVAAWRHVHDIFTTVGADNVTWVWCPNVDPDGIFHDLGSLYPGDAYVDWTGLDGYNWGLNPAKPDRWRSFDELYSATYRRIVDTIAPDKPMLIGEIGSTEQGGSKANWIEEALGAIPSGYPMIRGLLWFDTYDDGMDWPIETSPSAADAFAAAIQSPAYVDEGSAAVGDGPIAPPN